jgi:hypothetical protein
MLIDGSGELISSASHEFLRNARWDTAAEQQPREIMPKAVWSAVLKSSAPERRRERTIDVTRLDVRADGRREYETIGRPFPVCASPLLVLLLLQLAGTQSIQDHPRQRQSAIPLIGLGPVTDEESASPNAIYPSLDKQVALIKVDVVPTQPECFPAAQSLAQPEQGEGSQKRRSVQCAKEAPRVIQAWSWTPRTLPAEWRLYVFSRVSHQLAPLNGNVERSTQAQQR